MRFAPVFIAGLILAACGGEATTPTPAPTRPPEATITAAGETTPEATPAATQITAGPTEALTCDAIIHRAVSRVGDICDALGRNEACYGNTRVEAEFRENADARFNSAGDVVALASLRSIHTASLDVAQQQWGVAILKAQANLPGTLPGQNVTFLLYGDARVDNPSSDMQAVRITTGIGQLECEAAPQSAVLVQSPRGVDVAMTMNGAQVTLGSTIHIRAVANEALTLATIEGMAVVTAFGESQTVLPGLQVSLPLGEADGATVTGPPSEPEPFDAEALANAPVMLLERAVVIPPPAQLTATPGASVTPQSSARPTIGITPESSPTPVATRAAATPGGTVLTADTIMVSSGQCTTLHWNAAGARQVFFEGQAAPISGDRQVCPTHTTTYTLIVVGEDNSRTPYRVTVTVQ